MENNNYFFVFLTLCAFQARISESASLGLDTEIHSPHTYHLEQDTSAEGDLIYSDISTKHQETRDRLYRQLRQYGVPSDVAQMYVPRGLTVGELLGKDSPKTHHSSAEDDSSSNASSFDPWSIVWYIGSFGGLIAFFLVISCSEWCCLRSRAAATLAGATSGIAPAGGAHRTPRCPQATRRVAQQASIGCETPPPGYHLFAPPSYDDTVVFDNGLEINEKRKFDVFVVPVHSVPEVSGGCLGTSPPPQYTEMNLNTT